MGFHMYEKFYGLHTKPFSIIPNPDCIFLSEKHRNAINYIKHGLNAKNDILLLTGDAGTGKTTLLRHLMKKIQSHTYVAEVYHTTISPEQLLFQISKKLGVKTIAISKQQSLKILKQNLVDRYSNKRKVLLVIDETQNLSDEALEEIRLLSCLQRDRQMLLPILLAGQPELKARINGPGLKRISQRIGISYHLQPLDEHETAEYIEYRLQKAGDSAHTFSSEAMAFIHYATDGIPRAINLVCDTALVYGYADGSREINLELVEAVVNDQCGVGLYRGGKRVRPKTIPLSKTYLDKLDAIQTNLHNLMNLTTKQIKLQEQSLHAYQSNIDNRLMMMNQKEKIRNEILVRKYLKLKRQHAALISDE